LLQVSLVILHQVLIKSSNADWIRAGHGSKSVSLGNIIDAYSKAGGKGKLQEFANEEVALAEKYGEMGDKLPPHFTSGWSCFGTNNAGRNSKETLKSYASTLKKEELI
jgi:dipeptidyl-peptidase-3